jgi:uncharacterized protein
VTTSGERPSLVARVLRLLFPVVPDFYALLDDQCALAVEVTAKLAEFMQRADPTIAQAIHRLEREGDRVKTRNLDVLNRSFATAFDREDIDRAIRSIDEILNYANTTVGEVEALRVEPDAPMVEMATLLHEGTKSLRRGYALLARDPEAAEAAATAAGTAERRTEEIYRTALSRLFDDDRLAALAAGPRPEGTPTALREVVRMFRRREVYRHLSNAADRLAAAGGYLHDAIVKAM